MGHLSYRGLQRFSNAVLKLYDSPEPERIHERMIESVAALLIGDWVSWHVVDPITNAHRLFCNVEMPASAALQNRLQEVVFQNPIVPYVMNGGAKVAGDVREIISPYDLVSKREFQRTDLYNDVLREIGMTEHLVTLVPAGLVDLGPNPHRLDVLASSLFPAVHRRGHFRQDERELLKLLRPHLMKAYQAAHFQLRLRGNGVTVTDPRALMVYGLTQREVEVLHWMREGKTDKEIAVILGISFRTVNLHVAAILRKLGVETRLGAVLKTFGKA